MALAQDLMGLGISPLQAAHTASGGTGPLFAGTLASATSGFQASCRLGAYQFVITVTNNVVSTGGVGLPAVGSDSGCLLADDFVINNSGTHTILLFCSSGVTISTGGSNTSFTTLAVHSTITLYPLSTTTWIGVKGN